MKNKAMIVGIGLLFIGASVVSGVQIKSSPLPLSRGWLYVGGSGPGNYSTIQDAIDNASDGDTVFVCNGFYSDYTGPNSHACVTIKKEISLIGENKYNTIIDGSNQTFADIIWVEANNVTINNFTLQGGTDNDRGIYIYDSRNVRVHDTIITNNDDGIFPWNTINSSFYNNTIMNVSWGIYIDSQYNSSCIIHNNTIHNCDVGVILHAASGRNIIDHNDIRNNHKGIVFSRSTGIFRCNNLIKNKVNVQSMQMYKYEHVIADKSLLTSRAIWENNYWDKWKTSLPRPICAFSIVYFRMPRGPLPIWVSPTIQYDSNPAQEPYNIP